MLYGHMNFWRKGGLQMNQMMDAIEMRANILLRTTGMRDRDKRLDQLPFLIGKFITTGFHACTSFCLCLTTYLCLFLVRFAIFDFSDTP